MKRKKSCLTEVQVEGAPVLVPSPTWPASGAGAGFLVHLPEGATVAVPAGFDADEVFLLLLAVREVLR